MAQGSPREGWQEVDLAQRVYFHIPFEEKEDAKKMGCRWDPDRKKWYSVDSDEGRSKVTQCITRWSNPTPYKFINGAKVLITDIPGLVGHQPNILVIQSATKV